MHNHCPFGGDIFLHEQGGKLCLFQIADRILLAVILSEDEAREHALLREFDEHGGECRTLLEVCEISLQIVGRKLTAQTLHLLRIDGQTLARASEEACIGEQGATLAPALESILRNCARQDVECVQGNRGMRRMQGAQIVCQLRNIRRRNMRLARREESPREQLIHREDDGIRPARLMREPIPQRVRIARHGIVVHILRRRRYDIPSDNPAAAHNELPARRARVERHKQDAPPSCIYRHSGQRAPLSHICGMKYEVKEEQRDD